MSDPLSRRRFLKRAGMSLAALAVLPATEALAFSGRAEAPPRLQRLFVPHGYDPCRRYPLVICRDRTAVDEPGPLYHRFCDPLRQASRPAFVLSVGATLDSERWVTPILESLIPEYNVDDRSVYVATAQGAPLRARQ